MPALLDRIENGFARVSVWWAFGLVWAGASVWFGRFSMGPDALSYLDLGSTAARTGPGALLNGQWSPGYPALIAAALTLFHPSPGQEVPLLHFLNFPIFVFAFAAFMFFFQNWLRAIDSIHDANKRLTPFAFLIFLWFAIEIITVKMLSPDLAVAGFVFLAAGMVLYLARPGSTWKAYAGLGLILGLGYYVKAPLLPLGLALIAILLVWPPSAYVSRKKLLLAALVLLIAAAPLAALLSRQAGRFTVGESGRLNYLWHVNRIQQYVGWTGDSGDRYGAPIHPIHRLMEKPLTLEFAAPIGGTYPLWYDPAYWYAGAIPRLDWRQQLATLLNNLRGYFLLALWMSGFIAGAAALRILALRRGREPAARETPAASSPAGRERRWLLAWPLAACLIYWLLYVDFRYVGAFLAVFWLAVYTPLVLRVSARAGTAVLACLLVAHAVPAMGRMAWNIVHAQTPDYATVGSALEAAGLHQGDRLAVVGGGLCAYYARYTRTRVVAQIQDESAFWRLDASGLHEVAARLASAGVKALVAFDRPAGPGVWRDVYVPDGHRYGIMLIGATAK
jgi:multisubunit Na+/H+ antiporter MnhB subunit